MMGTKARLFTPIAVVSAERDVYMCAAGKELHFAPWHSTERSLRYRAYASDCNSCSLKA